MLRAFGIVLVLLVYFVMLIAWMVVGLFALETRALS
jgi:hypothetical protein